MHKIDKMNKLDKMDKLSGLLQKCKKYKFDPSIRSLSEYNCKKKISNSINCSKKYYDSINR